MKIRYEYKKLCTRLFLAEVHYKESVSLRLWKDAAEQASIMAEICLKIHELMKRPQAPSAEK